MSTDTGTTTFHPLAERWRDLWNTDPMRMVDEVYAEDLTAGAPQTVRFRTRAQLRVVETIFVEAAPHKEMIIERTTADDEVVVVEATIVDGDRPGWSVPLCALLTLDEHGQVINDTSYSDFAAWPSAPGGDVKMLEAGVEFAGPDGFAGAPPLPDAPLTTIPITWVTPAELSDGLHRWRDAWGAEPGGEEIYAKTATLEVPGVLSAQGSDRIEALTGVFRESTPGRNIIVSRTVSQDHRIVVEAVATDPTRPDWALPFCSVLTFDGGVITEETLHIDLTRVASAVDASERLRREGLNLLRDL
ncbi:nuclear transport factor 2 family protein [Nocardia sp. R16R-3T]